MAGDESYLQQAAQGAAEPLVVNANAARQVIEAYWTIMYVRKDFKAPFRGNWLNRSLQAVHMHTQRSPFAPPSPNPRCPCPQHTLPAGQKGTAVNEIGVPHL